MRVIIAGCRDFSDYEFISYNLKEHPWTCVGGPLEEFIYGKARGVDMAAWDYFYHERQLPEDKIKGFPYESNYGKAGGPIRNRKMAEYGTNLIAFWDGKSRGTLNMITEAVLANCEVCIIPIPKKK